MLHFINKKIYILPFERIKNSTIEIIGRIRRTNKKLSLAGKEIKIDEER